VRNDIKFQPRILLKVLACERKICLWMSQRGAFPAYNVHIAMRAGFCLLSLAPKKADNKTKH